MHGKTTVVTAALQEGAAIDQQDKVPPAIRKSRFWHLVISGHRPGRTGSAALCCPEEPRERNCRVAGPPRVPPRRLQGLALVLDYPDSSSFIRMQGDWTAQHWAAEYGHVDIIELLLAHPAPVDPISTVLCRSASVWFTRSGYHALGGPNTAVFCTRQESSRCRRRLPSTRSQYQPPRQGCIIGTLEALDDVDHAFWSRTATRRLSWLSRPTMSMARCIYSTMGPT